MAESIQSGDVSELGSKYETQAPEMRPLEEGEKKSVKWHRLDYYDIAPLKDDDEKNSGVLSRGGLMRRTAKRLRSDNQEVQLAAIYRCASEFHNLTEGPCLRPLLESIRDLAGHGRPSTPAAPNQPAGPGLAPISRGSSAKPRVERDEYGYGSNLLIALQALISFMEDTPLTIPEGVLEAAGESSMDGQQEEHTIRSLKPPASDNDKNTSAAASASTATEEEKKAAGYLAETALIKLKAKRATLVAKEMQRKKTMFESTDLLVLMMSPLCSISSAALCIYESLCEALLGEEMEDHGYDDERGQDEVSVSHTMISGSARTGMASFSTMGGEAKSSLLRMLASKGNPAAGLSNVIPKLSAWREEAKQASGRKNELAERMATVNEAARSATEASVQAVQAADAVRARCAEARGNKKRKKALPPDLADELTTAEQAEEIAANKMEEANKELEAAKEELTLLGDVGAKSYTNNVAVSVEEVTETTLRILRIIKFLWEENGELTLAQIIEGNVNTVPVLLELMLEPKFFSLCRVIFHAMTRPDITGGAAAVVLAGGSEPFITVLERQIEVCRNLPSKVTDAGVGRIARVPSAAETPSRRPSVAEEVVEHSNIESPAPLIELIEIVEVITAMASCDRSSIASNPNALKLFPAIPPLSNMLDLKLSHSDATTLNTAVFAALSALGLRSPEGRLQVCEQGAMPLLVKFVVASTSDPDDPHNSGIAVRERNLRRTADKALLHLLFSSVDQVDAKVLSGESPYLPIDAVVDGLSSREDNGRRRVTRLVATLTKCQENAAALGDAAVQALTKSVGTWRTVIAEQDEKDEKRFQAKEREEAAIQARAEAARLSGMSESLLRNQSYRENTIGEDEEEDSRGDPDGMDELLREDITEVDGLGELLYALQALSQLTKLGGTKAAMAVGSDELVEMLVEMLFECGRSDGTEVALRLCMITDLTWDFEPPPGEELNVEFRVLRAEAVNLLTALAHIPETAARVARHAGLALRMVASTYGRFAPGLQEPVEVSKGGDKFILPAWKLVLDPRAGQPRKGSDDESTTGESARTSPELMLALLRLIEKLATVKGGREGLYASACKVCFGGDVSADHQPNTFLAPPENSSIGSLIASPSKIGDSANSVQFSYFRPSCLVLMGVIGALSGGSMDVLQLQSALRSFKALCRDAKPTVPTSLQSKGKSKAFVANIDSILEETDGYQPVLADIFGACALRLGALVSLVMMPQHVPIVAGAWEVVCESNDLALFLTNRGACRENFWKSIPAPRTPRILRKIRNKSEIGEGSPKEDDDASVGSVESGGGSAGESLNSARLSVDEAAILEDSKGIPDPNSGPDRAQWAHLLNVSAFVQPHSSTDALQPAPAEHSAELCDLRAARGSHWTALMASIGGIPLWVPLTIQCNSEGNRHFQVELTIHVHGRGSTAPSTHQKPSVKNRMSKIGHLFEASSGAARVEDEVFDIEITILQAIGLPSADTVGKAGPFVQVRLEDRVMAATRVIPYSVNPVFNEKIKFTCTAADALGLRENTSNGKFGDGLIIEVWDSDVPVPSLIGSSKLPVLFPGLNDDYQHAGLVREGEKEAIEAEEDARLTAEMLVQTLLEGGANPEWRDAGGRTALMHSLALANNPATRLLLEDSRVDMNSRDDEGHTVLQYAFASPDPLAAKKALRDLFPDLQELTERASMTGTFDSASESNVLLLEGSLSMVTPVLEAGADPNEPDDDLGNFGLHWSLSGTEFDFQLPIGPRGTPKLLRLKCCPRGDVAIEAVRACLELGDAAVDACNREGETALHLVISGGHGVEALELLLAQGADPNLMDIQGEIPCHRFARHVVSEAPVMLAKLLEASKGKVLTHAVFNNDRRGLSADAKMELEVDAVFALCATELACPRSVAAVTANVDDVLAAKTAQGWSLMHCLAGAAIFDAAVQAACEGRNYDTEKVLHGSGDETSFAPMLHAALHASPPGSARLRHEESGLTPAHLAVRVFSSNTSIRMINDLVAFGCDLNALALLPPHPMLKRQRASDFLEIVGSPLSMAVCYPHSEGTARHLMSIKDVQSMPSGASPTPLHLACAVGASESTVAALLTARGVHALKVNFAGGNSAEADVAGGAQQDSDQTPGLTGTPLHAAASVGLESQSKALVVDLLLKSSVNSSNFCDFLGARDAVGRTALHVACLCNRLAATKALLEADGGVALALCKDTTNRTALHLAIDGRSEGCVEALVMSSDDVKKLVTYGQVATSINVGIVDTVLDEDAECEDNDLQETSFTSLPMDFSNGEIPTNVLLYAELVQSRELGSCRLEKLGYFKDLSVPTEEPSKPTTKKVAKRRKYEHKDYRGWRGAFRSEFALLTSQSTSVLNKVVMYLLRIAAGLSSDISFPAPPSPAAQEDTSFGEPGISSMKDIMSVGSVDSWEVLEGEQGDKVETEKLNGRDEEVDSLWIEALGFVEHVSPCYSRGRTLLQERWANIGPTAVTIIQAAVRKFLASCRVRKLKERLRQRRIAQAKAMQGSQRGRGGASRASVSSRSSAGSRATSRASRTSKRNSRANSVRSSKGGKGLRSSNSFTRPSSRESSSRVRE